LSWIFKQINDNFILIPTIVEMHALEKVNELFIIKWIEEKIVDCHISFVNNLCGRCLYIGWLLGFWCWYIFMPNLIDLWSINVCVLLIMYMCICMLLFFYFTLQCWEWDEIMPQHNLCYKSHDQREEDSCQRKSKLDILIFNNIWDVLYIEIAENETTN
jgi:hypothetical protein